MSCGENLSRSQPGETIVSHIAQTRTEGLRVEVFASAGVKSRIKLEEQQNPLKRRAWRLLVNCNQIVKKNIRSFGQVPSPKESGRCMSMQSVENMQGNILLCIHRPWRPPRQSKSTGEERKANQAEAQAPYLH